MDLVSEFTMDSEGIVATILDVLNSGNYILGENVKGFEKEFAKYCGARYGIGVGSGTDALTIALMALGIGQGDKVITVANTASPTAMAILNAGAIPTFVDPTPDSFLMSANSLKHVLTKNTKAIIPVHLYGNPCEMDSIIEFASDNELHVVEDCCQAHGARFKGTHVGCFGDIGCFSFYPTKNLGAFGDGGMVTTDSKDLAERLRRLRVYGMEKQYNSLERGVCSRLDEIQAAVLRRRLKHLNRHNQRRIANSRIYREILTECPSLKFQKVTLGGMHVYHQMVISCTHRDSLRKRLTAEGIGTGIHYPIPLCDQPAFASYANRRKDYPISRHLSKSVISLPIHPLIDTTSIEHICELVNDFVRQRTE